MMKSGSVLFWERMEFSPEWMSSLAHMGCETRGIQHVVSPARIGSGLAEGRFYQP